ncbi:MAG: hypothetical protein EBQ95_00175 [Gammaproteobacteria bacterium]|nr:hypothetical protein [Gammaproteobacteria bacterium]
MQLPAPSSWTSQAPNHESSGLALQDFVAQIYSVKLVTFSVQSRCWIIDNSTHR